MTEALYGAARHPAELMEQWSLGDGTRLTLRPVLPQDAAPLGAMIAAMSAPSRRRRFHGAVNAAGGSGLARMTCIDYRQQMALAVTCVQGDGEAVVADRWQRRGVGERAMGVRLRRRLLHAQRPRRDDAPARRLR
jgi:acetyltransferase